MIEKFKNKIIGIEFLYGEGLKGAYFRLINYDGNILEIQNCQGGIFYLPLSSCNMIEEAEDGGAKFYDYERRFREDPDFEGDSNDDKGYSVIKKRGKYE